MCVGGGGGQGSAICGVCYLGRCVGGGGKTPFCSILLCLGSAIWGDVCVEGEGGGGGGGTMTPLWDSMLVLGGVCYMGRCIGKHNPFLTVL